MCIHLNKGAGFLERPSHLNHTILSIQETQADQSDLEKIKNAVSLVQDLLQALNLANTDQIDLTVLRWKKMNEEGNNQIPDRITDLFKEISSKQKRAKYSFALRQRPLVATVLQSMVNAYVGKTRPCSLC